ncbi:MAG: LptE family protein [Nitrospirae bacterium]|nr:LptE family protein [Nitrospirota bacterium]
MKRFTVHCSLYFVSSILATVLLSTVLMGCGYHFIGSGSALPEHIKKVGIPLAVNRTPEPGLEDILAKALIEEFKKDGRLKVVSTEEADTILHSVVVSFQTVPLSFDNKGLVTVYRVVMKVDFKLEDIRDKKIIWEEREMESTLKSDYKPSNDLAVTRTLKDEAIRKTCRDISLDVISRIHEGF